MSNTLSHQAVPAPSLLVLVEKPSVMRDLKPFIDQAYPEYAISWLIACHLTYIELRLPRGQAYADYPVTPMPTGRLRPQARLVTPAQRYECPEHSPDEVVHHVGIALQDAHQVLVCADASASSQWSVSHLLTLHDVPTEKRCYAAITQLSADYLRAQFPVNTPGVPDWAASLIQHGEAYAYVDHAWAINSVALMPGGFISKYSLQWLYALNDAQLQETGLTMAELLQRFSRWPGSGKYPGTVMMGSAASLSAIFEQLCERGFLRCQSSTVETPSPADRWFLSASGRAYLAQLHPDCRDPDIAFRLKDWARHWPESIHQVTRYLRTFFGKQKRFKRRFSGVTALKTDSME